MTRQWRPVRQAPGGGSAEYRAPAPEDPDIHTETVQGPVAVGFREAAFFDAALRRDEFAGELVLFQHLQQMLGRDMLFQMEIDQGAQLVFEFHFKGPVSP